LRLFIAAALVFIINVPFGYWRDTVKKFSLKWLLAVHLPVPVVVLIRIYSDIGFQFYTYPILVGAFFIGQFAGARFHRYKMMKNNLASEVNE
jgi:hypothetical protein